MVERSKNILYAASLYCAKLYWKLFRPRTQGARIILIAAGQVLLVRHRGSRYFNLPGGGIKKSENPEQGALRELFEETHIKLEKADYLLGTYTNTSEGKSDTVFVWVREIPELITPMVAFELSNAQWFPLDALPESTSPATRARMSEVVAGCRDIEAPWILSEER